MNDHDYRSLYPAEPTYANQGVHSSAYQWFDRPNIELTKSTRGVAEVVVMKPDRFEAVMQAIQALWERKTVIVNLTCLDLDTAQRAIDFISGGIYALDGNQEQIGEAIFLFTPNAIAINTVVRASQRQPPLPSPVPPLLQQR